MSHEIIGKLIDKWMQDATFRAAMRKDARGALRATGLPLSQEEWETVDRIDWKLSDEQLKARVSKAA